MPYPIKIKNCFLKDTRKKVKRRATDRGRHLQKGSCPGVRKAHPRAEPRMRPYWDDRNSRAQERRHQGDAKGTTEVGFLTEGQHRGLQGGGKQYCGGHTAAGSVKTTKLSTK